MSTAERLLKSNRSTSRPLPPVPRVLIVGPSLRIMGGQAVMVDRLLQAMRADGVEVNLQPINPVPPLGLRWTERIKGLRTIVVSTVYLCGLLRRVPRHDVVHLFSASYLSFMISQLPAILVARWFRRPIVLNYHSGQAEDHLRRWGRIVFAVLRMTDRIVVQNGFLVDVFARFGFAAEAIPNDVDMRAFRFREREQLQPRILVPRALEPLYNIGCALRAFQLLQTDYPDATLTVLGTGPQRRRLERLARELQLKQVTFTGRVERCDVPDYYDRHDIFLNSSSIDNMPVSILEAFAAGLPVVTTAAGGIPWMVTDRVTGHLTPLDDHRELARRVREVLNSPVETRRIIERARDELQQYSWSEIGQRWYKLYNQLVPPKTRRT